MRYVIIQKNKQWYTLKMKIVGIIILSIKIRGKREWLIILLSHAWYNLLFDSKYDDFHIALYIFYIYLIFFKYLKLVPALSVLNTNVLIYLVHFFVF